MVAGILFTFSTAFAGGALAMQLADNDFARDYPWLATVLWGLCALSFLGALLATKRVRSWFGFQAGEGSPKVHIDRTGGSVSVVIHERDPRSSESGNGPVIRNDSVALKQYLLSVVK